MPLYEFVCPAAHKTEKLASMTTEVIACACGQAATRIAINHIGFSGFASTPSAQRDWRNDLRRYQEAAQETEYNRQRASNEVGREVRLPSLAPLAKANAKKLARAGVTADQIST